MPTDFEIAFANARRAGLKTFKYGGKLYTTQYREEKIFDDIVRDNPMLGSIYNQDNTVISLADKKRRELSKKYGGGGAIETWFPDDEGPAGFRNPNLGKFTFEVYDDNLYKDDEALKTSIFLDMIHGAKSNQEFAKLRSEFNKNWNQGELDFIRNKYEKEANKGESFSEYMDRTVIDGYLRGGLNPMSDEALMAGKYNDEYAQIYRGMIKENGQPLDIYSPKQRGIIEQMKQILKKKQ
jgi:hypothetical protein